MSYLRQRVKAGGELGKTQGYPQSQHNVRPVWNHSLADGFSPKVDSRGDKKDKKRQRQKSHAQKNEKIYSAAPSSNKKVNNNFRKDPRSLLKG